MGSTSREKRSSNGEKPPGWSKEDEESSEIGENKRERGGSKVEAREKRVGGGKVGKAGRLTCCNGNASGEISSSRYLTQ